MPGARLRARGGFCRTKVLGQSPGQLLVTSANGRRLQRYGQPFLRREASAAWGLFQAVSEADAYDWIDRRVAQGFNCAKASIISKDENLPGSPPNWAGNAPFTTPGDFSTASGATAYWNHVDAVINYAASRTLLDGSVGFHLELVPSYLGYIGVGGTQGWADEMNADTDAHCAAYGTFLGNRYKNFDNISWCFGGDQVPGTGNGTSVLLSRFTSLHDALLAADLRHLITAHYAGGYAGALGATDDPQSSGMLSTDFATYASVIQSRGYNGHYGYSPSGEVWERIRAAYALSPVCPVVLLDESYGDLLSQGQPQGSPLEMRAKTHSGMLEGASGWSFGYGTDWYVWNPLPTSAVSQALQENIYATTFWQAQPWYLMAPDTADQWVISGRSSGAGYVNALASDSRLIMLFRNGAGVAPTVDMTQLAGAGATVIGEKWDPTSGITTSLSGSPFSTTGTRQITQASLGANSAGQNDWLVVLR